MNKKWVFDTSNHKVGGTALLFVDNINSTGLNSNAINFA